MSHTDKKPLEPNGRIALRVEGRNYNAYYARPDTMEGAIFLASVPFIWIRAKKSNFHSYINMCCSIVHLCLGVTIEWNEPMPAPEHERTKE